MLYAHVSHCSPHARCESADEDEPQVLLSRSSISKRKNPISEHTQREMAEDNMRKDEEHAKGKEKRSRKGSGAEEESEENAADYNEVVYTGEIKSGSAYEAIGNSRRRGEGGAIVVMTLTTNGSARYYALNHTLRMVREFRRVQIALEDVIQSPRVLTTLRHTGEIAAAHVQASPAELKVYYEMIQEAKEAETLLRQEEEQRKEEERRGPIH
ncbi:hypothetical protein P7C71_g4603, partial [Lecanoromycetidae sp. Uapishka_2]